MKFKALIILFVLNFIGCEQIKTKKVENNTKNFVRIDKSVIAVMTLDSETNKIFQIFKNSSPTNLTNQDLIIIEQILRKSVEIYNYKIEKFYTQLKMKNPDSTIKKEDFTLNLKSYKRQYFAVINKKGEKEIWVNCFCDESKTNWKTELIYVFDGGNCYFNLKINLTKKMYYDFSVNSRA